MVIFWESTATLSSFYSFTVDFASCIMGTCRAQEAVEQALCRLGAMSVDSFVSEIHKGGISPVFSGCWLPGNLLVDMFIIFASWIENSPSANKILNVLINKVKTGLF